MSNQANQSHQPELSEAFASKFRFAALTFASTDQRRKTAARFARHHMPADVAAAATTLFRANKPDPTLPEPSTRSNPIDQTLPVLGRLRVLVPLIDPNVLPMARCHTLPGRRPSVTVDDEGVYRVTWQTRADHERATREAYNLYTSSHEVTVSVGAGNSALDTWHDPFLLISVRHTYADGTPSTARWLCADGNARLFGARTALARDLTAWGVEHEWTDPSALWSADMGTVRKAVTAARNNLTGNGTDPAALPWPTGASAVEQWADLVLPEPKRTLNTISTWLYHEHNSRRDTIEAIFPVEEHLDDWLTSIDLFSGLSADKIGEILGVDVATKDGRAEVADYEAELGRFLRGVDSRKDVTATRLALAAIALDQTPSDASAFTVPVLDEWAGEEFATSGWFRNGTIYADYTSRAVAAVRQGDYNLVKSINTLREHVAAQRTFPDADLYGIWQDLRNGVDGTRLGDGPLTIPDSDWFTLTAMWGLTYATLYGHLRFASRTRPLAAVREQDYNRLVDETEARFEAEGREFTDADYPAEAPQTSEEKQEEALAFLFTETPPVLDLLLTTLDGQEVVLYYAQCASRSVIPEDRITALVRATRSRNRASGTAGSTAGSGGSDGAA